MSPQFIFIIAAMIILTLHRSGGNDTTPPEPTAFGDIFALVAR